MTTLSSSFAADIAVARRGRAIRGGANPSVQDDHKRSTAQNLAVIMRGGKRTVCESL